MDFTKIGISTTTTTQRELRTKSSTHKTSMIMREVLRFLLGVAVLAPSSMAFSAVPAQKVSGFCSTVRDQFDSNLMVEMPGRHTISQIPRLTAPSLSASRIIDILLEDFLR
jgi:hypothetical protein